jgi:hypothetical protein
MFDETIRDPITVTTREPHGYELGQEGTLCINGVTCVFARGASLATLERRATYGNGRKARSARKRITSGRVTRWRVTAVTHRTFTLEST